MEKMNIGLWLEQERMKLKLTREQLAQKVGCSVQTIHGTERGFRAHFRAIDEYHPYRPGEKLMEAIAAQFEKSLDDVYRETDYKDLTVGKIKFGYKKPHKNGTKKRKKDKPVLETQNKESEAVKITIHEDNSLPPIRFFVMNNKDFIYETDSKEQAISFIAGYKRALKSVENNLTATVITNFSVHQGYLKEVKL